MFSKGRHKPTKSQIHARHKPQMLADQRRQFAQQKTTRKLKPKIVLNNLAAHEPHINIQLGNMRIPLLLLLLIVLPQVFADTNMQRILIDGLKVHDKTVALLPPDAKCRSNPLGVSKGSICKFDSTTHYIKTVRMTGSKTQHLSYQVFNHQLAESTVGIKTAEVSFFKKRYNDYSIYISSKHVDGIKFIDGRDDTDKLRKPDIAKWAVASTFIYDLHTKNVGYTDEGIVAVDLDGHNRPLTNDFNINLMTAAHTINIHTPWLSLDDLRQMQNTYREMQQTPLPHHHDSFHLTETMYQDMLKAYISICDNVISALEPITSVADRSRPDSKVNQLWCEKAKHQISWWYRPNGKFYNELCDEKKPKQQLPAHAKPGIGRIGFKKYPKEAESGMKSKPNAARLQRKKMSKNSEESGPSFSP